MTVEIPLSRGKGAALIDAADVYLVENLCWRLERGYARTNIPFVGGRLTIRMHRLIMDAPKGIEVDHINRDKLDNRRSNLRLATRRQQMGNTGLYSSNTSGYRGVSWHINHQWWIAYIRFGYLRHLGHYDNPVDAALAYDAAAAELFGEFAVLNFPERAV